MKRLLTIAMTVITIALFASSAIAYELPNYTEEVMKSVANVLGVEIVGDIQRTEVPTSEGVLAHYTALITVGPFKYDKIGIHRVVKETVPGIPAHTTDGILCSGGDMSNFNLIYMPTTLPDPTGSGYTLGQLIGAPDHSLGIYLAKNDMDVWGIDWRWATIVADPYDPTTYPVPQIDPNTGQILDPGIMHLNTDTHLDDFEVTLKFARLTRLLTGQGYGKIYLTGHSRGAYMSLALANRQAEYWRYKRDIKGIIPVDFPFKSDDPAIQQTGCARVAGYDHVMDLMANNGGVYPPFAGRPDLVPPVFNTTGLAFMDVCYNSLTNPTGLNELFGASNENVFDIFAGATWFPFTLYAGGTGDWQWGFWSSAPMMTLGKYDDGNPYYGVLPFPVVFPNPLYPSLDTDMVYTNSLYIKLAGLYVAPFQSYGEQRDSMVVLCEGDSLHDDNLSQVTIPALVVACDGGAIAGSADAILNRLGGADKEVLNLTGDYVDPVFGVTVPYGHGDPYFANDAEIKFWQPMLEWIQTR